MSTTMYVLIQYFNAFSASTSTLHVKSITCIITVKIGHYFLFYSFILRLAKKKKRFHFFILMFLLLLLELRNVCVSWQIISK